MYLDHTVLETLAKSEMSSRAEITDAAMGRRPQRVMLNKGSQCSARSVCWTISWADAVAQKQKAGLLRELRLAKALPAEIIRLEPERDREPMSCRTKR